MFKTLSNSKSLTIQTLLQDGLFRVKMDFLTITQKQMCTMVKQYCSNLLDVKLVFSSFNIGFLFSVKDPIPWAGSGRVLHDQ